MKQHNTILKFTPYAWAKLNYFCHKGQTEIGGFGITNNNPLLVEDFITVKQKTTQVSVEFDDISVADFFEDQVDEGRHPEQFARIWLHTHPGSCQKPSGVDEETFSRVFGKCDWAIMLILAENGQTYARTHFNTGPGGNMKIKVGVDYNSDFPGSAIKEWEKEYKTNIHPIKDSNPFTRSNMEIDEWEEDDSWGELDEQRYEEEYYGTL